MWQFSRSPRHTETTIKCHECSGILHAERSCHEVYLRCTKCNAVRPVQEYIRDMDDALEQFMENVFCDRV